MADYRLSDAAEADIEAIHLDTDETFGPRQAARYIDGLTRSFQMLADFPRTGRSADDLHPDLFRFPHQSHVILYSIEPDRIVIRRVVHGRMNLSDRF